MPSGQAMAMSTNEPSSTATDIVLTKRTTPSGPSPTASLDDARRRAVAGGGGGDRRCRRRGGRAVATVVVAASVAIVKRERAVATRCAVLVADLPADDALALGSAAGDRHGERQQVGADLRVADGHRRRRRTTTATMFCWPSGSANFISIDAGDDVDGATRRPAWSCRSSCAAAAGEAPSSQATSDARARRRRVADGADARAVVAGPACRAGGRDARVTRVALIGCMFGRRDVSPE